MNPFLCAIFLLGLSSLASAANFTQVFEWNNLDYEWPSDARRAQALENGTFKAENISPLYMAVYGSRLFLSLEKNIGIPVTLVSLPTNSASTAPPKLTPFPSFDMHGNGNCDKIEWARGLKVDSVGRLWMLDRGSDNCQSKIWTIDLINNDHTKLIHRFSFNDWIHDLVLEETPNGTFAYISRWYRTHIVVFSLERNQSWVVDTLGIQFYSIALPPKDQEPRQLYLGKFYSNELYSIPVAALHNGTLTANPKLIRKWTAIDSYSMLMDNHGTMYAAFWSKNYISSWNSSQPFEEQRFHEVAGLSSPWPFTFALDQSGNFWITVNDRSKMPRLRLLKAEVGVKSYIFEASPAFRSPPCFLFPSPDVTAADVTGQPSLIVRPPILNQQLTGVGLEIDSWATVGFVDSGIIFASPSKLIFGMLSTLNFKNLQELA
ncbi:Hypothetical predicted protein [Cloeon dipterum]|uniref:Bee-milk protein n=1 Tax=Cloeon dipterum TaxID=197152 RepID=A0A8S1DI45_9INSE|nr:Hypothetical predicted protein [Cloeon dipterum]